MLIICMLLLFRFFHNSDTNSIYSINFIMTIRDIVDLLSDKYVTYELDVRHINTSRDTLFSKKEKLIEILEEEDANDDDNAQLLSHIEPNADLAECKTLLSDMQSYFMRRGVEVATRVDANLKFLLPRICRIQAMDGTPQNFLKNFMISDIRSLKDELSYVSVPVHMANNLSNSMSYLSANENANDRAPVEANNGSGNPADPLPPFIQPTNIGNQPNNTNLCYLAQHPFSANNNGPCPGSIPVWHPNQNPHPYHNNVQRFSGQCPPYPLQQVFPNAAITGPNHFGSMPTSNIPCNNYTTSFQPQAPVYPQQTQRPALYNNVPNRTTINSVPVWKWKIRFSGDDDASASEFLQDVEEYRRSRGASEEDLLACISDLLEGSARKWFRAMCRTRPFVGWFDFTERFRMDFEPNLTGDGLIDEIRSRIQKPSESIVKYFITMENLFLRLPRPLPMYEVISILRKNILPHISQGLAVYDFEDVESFKHACKRYERNYNQSQSRNLPAQSVTPDQQNKNLSANRAPGNWNNQQRYPNQNQNRNDNRRNDTYYNRNQIYSNSNTNQNRNTTQPSSQPVTGPSRPKINSLTVTMSEQSYTNSTPASFDQVNPLIDIYNDNQMQSNGIPIYRDSENLNGTSLGSTIVPLSSDPNQIL